MDWLTTSSPPPRPCRSLATRSPRTAPGRRRRRSCGVAVPARELPVDLDVVRQAARMPVTDPRPGRDVLIGMTALTHNLTVVTDNTADFERLGVALVTP